MITRFLSLKLTPYLLALVLAVGGFIYIKHLGHVSEQRKQLQRDADEAKDDIYIEKKQSEIINGRDNYNLIKRLREGTF